MASRTPTLVFIVGPPAVGKMTVGAALAARTGFKLFHNHRTIDLVLPFFAFGSPPFDRLVGEFRRRLLEEVASSDLPGIIFTFVWAFDQPTDDAVVEEYSGIFRRKGGAVFYVELQASQEVRLQRNETELRLAEKPSKRDLAESRRRLISLDSYQLDSRGRFEGRPDYLRIDNTDLSPEDVAQKIVRSSVLRSAPARSLRRRGAPPASRQPTPCRIRGAPGQAGMRRARRARSQVSARGTKT